MRREAYKAESNEIERQFAQHNLDRDMAADYRASALISPDQHVRKLRAQNRGILLFLAVIFVVFGLAVWLL